MTYNNSTDLLINKDLSNNDSDMDVTLTLDNLVKTGKLPNTDEYYDMDMWNVSRGVYHLSDMLMQINGVEMDRVLAHQIYKMIVDCVPDQIAIIQKLLQQMASVDLAWLFTDVEQFDNSIL